MTGRWTVLARRHGVSLRVCGQGPPVVVIPGMEGSGESCLDVVLPVVRTGIRVPVEAPGGLGGAFAGTPGRSPDAETGASGGRVILVDYSAERHRLLGQLVGTIAGLLRQVLPPDEPVVWWGQSFGNLLIALVRQRLDLARGAGGAGEPFYRSSGRTRTHRSCCDGAHSVERLREYGSTHRAVAFRSGSRRCRRAFFSVR
ncbi:hypothetical protein [Fodinicola feengrottensis]|uniref:hypothetical protein n=1 Tax=Fodinicola feengrottensis TaxID=435914 RepID=UPI0013D02C9E|nr:hypothetical protein [Fodinicola feengrottensis]